MTSQLIGTEGNLSVCPCEYRLFGPDRITHLMPKLVQGDECLPRRTYYLVGTKSSINRRRFDSEKMQKKDFQSKCLWTGDTIVYDEMGGAIITKDSPLLQEITPESPLTNDGALELKLEQVEDLKKDRYSLFLSKEEVEEANGKGFILGKGYLHNLEGNIRPGTEHIVFVPANETVKKIWGGKNGKGKVILKVF